MFQTKPADVMESTMYVINTSSYSW